MGSNFRVALSGDGRVLDMLLDLIEAGQYPFVAVAASSNIEDFDVLVDCSAGDENLKLVESSLLGGVPVVLCSKTLAASHGGRLSILAKSTKNKIYLNSLFASKEKNQYTFLTITEKNISNFDSKEYLDIASDEESVASILYQDLVRAHNRWDPRFEADRLARENKKREALKQNIYSVAKKLNVEVEAQPCGIDPKLPDNIEVPNVSTNNQ
jgi:hypothetical protein